MIRAQMLPLRRRLTSTAALGLLSGLASLTATGCLDHPVKAVRIGSDQVGQKTVNLVINKDVDVLFVIDNSGSMGEEQAALSANFGNFVDVLEAKDVDANYRLGVTTTDIGHWACTKGSPEQGRLRLESCLDREGEFQDQQSINIRFNTACASNCKYDSDDLEIQETPLEADGELAPRAWLERNNGETNLVNKDISTADAFKCFGPQGIDGCGYEAQLESMYYALRKSFEGKDASDGTNPNHGFIRDSAILAIVHVTDEVDCSLNLGRSTDLNDDIKAAFSSDNETFWVPGMTGPTSAICFQAGVECEDGSGAPPGEYETCTAQDYDKDRKKLNSDDARDKAILRPVKFYTDYVQGIEEEKAALIAGQEVIVALIGGVDDDGRAHYRHGHDASGIELDNYPNFGIGFGCNEPAEFLEEKDPANPAETVPGGTEPGFAMPPVRLREFTEYFSDDSSDQVMYKICDEDFAGPLEKIAEKIRDQIKPACYQNCVLDREPDIERLVPECSVVQVSTDEDGEDKRKELVECEREDGEDSPYIFDEEDGTYSIPEGEDVCYIMLTDHNGNITPDDDWDNLAPECKAAGYNLEFKLQRARGSGAKAGTTTSAVCELSTQQDIDCSWDD